MIKKNELDIYDIPTPIESELLAELTGYKEKLGAFITDTTQLVWRALDENKKILKFHDFRRKRT